MKTATVALIFLASQAAAQSATVSGTDGQSALGTIPCAALAGQTIGQCPAEMRRAGDGKATLAVQLPTGEVRRIYFEGGKPTSSTSLSNITHEISGDTMVIFIEPNEVYEIPASAAQ